jgi:AcrR family transcriptional regulator
VPRVTANKANELRRRAAEANVAAILDGTVALLEHHSKPSFVDIARAARVSRPTLYAHFPTREDLIEAVVKRAIESTARDVAGARLEEGAADLALRRLVVMGWRGLSRQRTIFRLAMDLPPKRRRQVHESALEPVRRLLMRGQRSGEFRDDQPTEWMVSLLYALLHAAAEDVAAGRLDDDVVGELVYASAIGALRPPNGDRS